jgi:hypothetical protein
MRRALREFPRTLDETYLRILTNIDPQWQHYIYDILTFLAFSLRPLKLKEVVDAIAFDANTGGFSDEEQIADPLDILTVGSGLIALSNSGEVEERELRFTHFSVKEYIVSHRAARYQITEDRAHFMIAERCLLYLISNLDIPALSIHDLRRFGFLEYSAEFWYQHLKKIMSSQGKIMSSQEKIMLNQDSNLLGDRMNQFLDITARRCFSNSLRARDPETQEYWPKYLNVPDPLYYVSFLDYTIEYPFF